MTTVPRREGIAHDEEALGPEVLLVELGCPLVESLVVVVAIADHRIQKGERASHRFPIVGSHGIPRDVRAVSGVIHRQDRVGMPVVQEDLPIVVPPAGDIIPDRSPVSVRCLASAVPPAGGMRRCRIHTHRDDQRGRLDVRVVGCELLEPSHRIGRNAYRTEGRAHSNSQGAGGFGDRVAHGRRNGDSAPGNKCPSGKG